MKAVILAAGRGTRIYPVTQGVPKCLLSFDGRTILDYQMESVRRVGIRQIAIVVGYNRQWIIDHVQQYRPSLQPVEFIVNANFASTNNMYSLWLARDWLGDSGFLCLNGDVLFHPGILLPAASTRGDLSVVIDRVFREETTKVITRNGKVLELKKSIPRQQAGGTFVNIATFSGQGARILFERAESMFAEGERNQFFNDILSRLAAERVKVGFTETGGLPWAEVDDVEDLLFARKHIYPKLKSVFGPDLVSRPARSAYSPPGLASVHEGNSP